MIKLNNTKRKLPWINKEKRGGGKKKLQKEELHTNNMSVVQYYKEICCCLQREASAQCGYFENIIYDKNIETAQN
jgi:hypothetical protein